MTLQIKLGILQEVYYVRITHGFGWSSVYGHLSSIAVCVGARHTPGSYIGRTGSSGRVTGPHLHFGVYYHRQAVDGQRYLRLLDQLISDILVAKVGAIPNHP